MANKLAKGFIRTRHIESNSRLCMASASSGYKLSLGADGPPGSYQDFEHAEVFLVIGANMADCHPILFLRMMDRVKAGAKLIVATNLAGLDDVFAVLDQSNPLILVAPSRAANACERVLAGSMLCISSGHFRNSTAKSHAAMQPSKA